jgi:chaperone LolA
MAVLLLLSPQEPSLSQIVDGVVQRYSKMKDFSAEFVQSKKESNRSRVFRGLLYLKTGKRLLIEVKSPELEAKYIYSDGKTYIDYQVFPKQAHFYKFSKAEDDRLQLFQIPWNPEWKNQFSERHRLLDTKTGNAVIRLVPNKKDLPEIELEVDKKTFLIQRFVTTFEDGDSNEFSFTGIKTTPVDEKIFIFNRPPNVKVIDHR